MWLFSRKSLYSLVSTFFIIHFLANTFLVIFPIRFLIRDFTISLEYSHSFSNIWTNSILYGDWILSTLKMLEIIKDRQCSLSDIVKTFPQYYMKKTNYSCPEQIKQFVLNQVLKEWRKRKEKAKITTIDGFRIDYLDGSWILFRPSGTEPVFRVYTESRKESRTKELAIIGSKIINKSLQVARLKQI